MHENALKQKEQLLAQAAKARDKAHAEADRIHDETVAKEKNPLKKQGVKVLAGKTRDKAKQKADEAYEVAVAKANKVVEDAQKEADALGN